MSSDGGGRALVYLGIGFFAGVYYFYKGLNSFRLKKLVENTPTSKVRSVALGLVELYGGAEPDSEKRDFLEIDPDLESDIALRMVAEEIDATKGLMKAPFSGKDCVYCYYSVEVYKSGKNGGWKKMLDDDIRILFYLNDETGKVLVNPEDAEMELSMSYDEEFSGDLPKKLQKFLELKGESSKSFLGFDKNLRFRECIIEPGGKVYVLGTAEENPFAGKKKDITQHTDRLIITKGKNPSTYYISDDQEYKVKSYLTSEFLIKVYGGAALSVVCLGLILLMLRLL